MKTTPLRKAATCLLFATAPSIQAATIAYWDFEDGTAGEFFTPAGTPNGTGGSLDTANSTLMRGWNDVFGPLYTADGPPNGGNLAMRGVNQDGYVTEGALHNWGPSAWTIETTVLLDDVNGWRTLIGRDGSSIAVPESDFYLANNGIDNRFRINYLSANGTRWILDGDYIVLNNTWYGLAARSDGQTLSLWLDDGSGYQQIGSLDISSQSATDNALRNSGLAWTFGRGWYNGAFVDRISGTMDNIRFSDLALEPNQMIALIPEPSSTALAVLATLGFMRRRRS